jgi:hypothetical protein
MAMRYTVRNLVGALALLVLPSATRAQLPAKPENLQVLPKDMPTDTVVRIMRGVAMSLGVRCTFCHVEREGAAAAPAGGGGGPFQNFDFKADDKDHKKIARIMMRMTDSINTRFLASIPNRDDPPTSVNCMTCHRGLPKPGNIETVLSSTTTRSGADSAVALYRALRTDMASGKYNFGEQPVMDVAQRLIVQQKYDDAIKLLQMNQEFHPNSVNIDYQLAEAYIAKGDKDAGVARLRTMLTKNPNDRRARQRLQQLGVQP